MLTDFMIIGATIIAGYIDFDSPSKTKTEFLNEVLAMCVLYCMISFSPLVPDPATKQKSGYFLCLLVAIHLAINLFLILSAMAREVILKLKLWLARIRLAKQRSENAVLIKSRKHIRRDLMAKPEEPSLCPGADLEVI